MSGSGTHFRSAAKPAPIPDFLVGVFTDTKIRLYISASRHSGRVSNSLSSRDRAVNVRAEEQVLPPSALDDLVQTGLIDGETIRVPGVDTSLVEIDNGDLDVWAAVV